MKSMLKTRFAPSPTGLMHLGNARTALFSFLLAKNQEGVFLLRIEDTDRDRSRDDYDRDLQQELHWLHLDWQEGPYYQSQRQAIYDDFYHRLESQGAAYPCFCTEEQLQWMRKVQKSQGKPPRYAGTCRSLSSDEIEQKRSSGLKPTLRFRVPHNQVICFMDLVRGEQRFNSHDIGDFIIRRANGTSPFMFCSALDDALMGVTHVLRGEDHLTNTPRQLMLLQALNLNIPHYGHISLIVGEDGSPLSKRHGSRSLKELREQGYLPNAVLNYLARLGHYYAEEILMPLNTLSREFKLSALSKSPARFDLKQMNYWQKLAVGALSSDEFWNWAGPDILQNVPNLVCEKFIEIVKPNVRFPQEIKYWSDVCFSDTLIIDEAQCDILKRTGKLYFQKALHEVRQHGKNLKTIIESLKSTLNLKGKPLYEPLRIALTGRDYGPELGKLMDLMDVNLIVKRLHYAENL